MNSPTFLKLDHLLVNAAHIAVVDERGASYVLRGKAATPVNNPVHRLALISVAQVGGFLKVGRRLINPQHILSIDEDFANIVFDTGTKIPVAAIADRSGLQTALQTTISGHPLPDSISGEEAPLPPSQPAPRGAHPTRRPLGDPRPVPAEVPVPIPEPISSPTSPTSQEVQEVQEGHQIPADFDARPEQPVAIQSPATTIVDVDLTSPQSISTSANLEVSAGTASPLSSYPPGTIIRRGVVILPAA
jgi:hypothetical protein